jgi:pimeloyl-ACP methyl ester carboxylesterase
VPQSTVFLLLAVLALALGIAGCSRLAESREQTWQEAYPPVGRLLDIDGRQVHVVEAGQAAGTAPDIVLIHGANGNLRDFTFDLVDRLAPDWRVIAVDRPGLGWSDSWGEADSDPRPGPHPAPARSRNWASSGPSCWAIPMAARSRWPGRWRPRGRRRAGPARPGFASLAGRAGLLVPDQRHRPGRCGAHLLAALTPRPVADRVVATVFAPDPMPPGYAAHFGTGLSMRRASQEANNRQVNALFGHVSEMHRGYPSLTLPIEACTAPPTRSSGCTCIPSVWPQRSRRPI